MLSISPEQATRIRLGGGNVAVKISKQLTGAIERTLLREISALSSLSHPNVVELLDIIIESGVFGIVEPASEGGSLESFLADKTKRKLLSVNGHFLARIFSYQLIRGVTYLLSKDVWHRDLKPGNLLLYKETLDGDRRSKLISKGWADTELVGRLAIADFGLSRVGMCSAVGDPYSLLLGTIRYMAPEVMLGGKYTPKSETWTIGVIIAELFLSSGYIFKAITLKGGKTYEFFPSLSAVLGEPIPTLIPTTTVSMPSTTPILSTSWNGVEKFRYFKEIPLRPETLKDETEDWINRTGRFNSIPPDIHALLRRALHYDPEQRPALSELLSDLAWKEIREYIETTIPASSDTLSCRVNTLAGEPPPPMQYPESVSARVPTSTLILTIAAGEGVRLNLRSIALACHLLIYYPQLGGTKSSIAAALHLAGVIHDRSRRDLLSDLRLILDFPNETLTTTTEVGFVKLSNAHVSPSTVFDLFRAFSRRKVYSIATRKAGEALSFLSLLTPTVRKYRVRDVALSVLAIACKSMSQVYQEDVPISLLPIQELHFDLHSLISTPLPGIDKILTLLKNVVKVDVPSIIV